MRSDERSWDDRSPSSPALTMSTSRESHPTFRRIADKPSCLSPGPEKMCRQEGLRLGGGSQGAATGATTGRGTGMMAARGRLDVARSAGESRGGAPEGGGIVELPSGASCQEALARLPLPLPLPLV